MHIYDYRGGDISEQYTLLYNPYSLACKEINIITNLSTMQRSTMQSIMQPSKISSWPSIRKLFIQLAQIKIKFFHEYSCNTDKYWPHLNDFL